MLFNHDFFIKLSAHLELPAEACDILSSLYLKHGHLKELEDKLFSPLVKEENLAKELKAVAKKSDTHEYSLAYYFLFYSAKRLHALYLEKSIDQNIFWDSILDLKYKLKECYDVHGIWGTFVFGIWFAGFYRLKRFALGRFQYDITKFGKKIYIKNRKIVWPWSKAYFCHIPSSGPLTKQVAHDSYKKACEFFKKDTIAIVTGSWLIYPPNRDFLPPTSKILSFMDDFDIISSQDDPKFEDSWRIFGANHKLPPDQLPTDTSLQKAYANRLKENKPTGTGFGIIIFNKDKGILNQ